MRLQFTEFLLDRHELGHCTEAVDHVTLLDGGTMSARVIGVYCGRLTRFAVLSSDRDLMVRFSSDRLTAPGSSIHNDSFVRRGFHAQFSFERADNATVFMDRSRYVDIGGHSADWDVDHSDDQLRGFLSVTRTRHSHTLHEPVAYLGFKRGNPAFLSSPIPSPLE